MFEGLSEVPQPMRSSHDVGMRNECHHTRRLLRVGIELFKLIDGAVPIFCCLVMLDQHHGHIVALLCVWHAHERPCASLQKNGLIIENPVTEVFIAFLGQDVWRVPGFCQSGTEPSTWRPACKFADGVRGLQNVCPFIWNFLHILLAEAVPDEFPASLLRGMRDRFVSTDC